MARLVIVSNRVPVPSESGPRAGGLAVALKDVLKEGGLWFGWSGEISDKPSEQAQIVGAGKTDYATVDLSEDAYRHFYVGFANSTLWPLLHYRPGLLEFDRADFESYLAVNRSFARALLPLLRPDDLVWVHDYHMIPFAAELRALGVGSRLGYFQHIPFVPPSLLQLLPQSDRLLRMLGAYDVVGFQTQQDVNEFNDCLARILPGERLRAHAIANPIGIDARSFARLAKRSASSPAARRLVESLVGRALIIGVDRLDYSKGLPVRFEAFSRLLERHPEHRLKVSYLQIAARSREDVAEYQRLKRDLDRRAGEVNGRFAEFDWVPLRYMTRPVARNNIAGFYRHARVGLVTPLKDGMNLVAKEYVAAQDADDPGVLVLSRFAGAAEELDAAIIVNPYDADEIVEGMHTALSMSLEERKQRHARLLEKVNKTTAQTYSKGFVAALEAAPQVDEPLDVGAVARTARREPGARPGSGELH